MTRELIWIPQGEVFDGITVKVVPPIPYPNDKRKPTRLWSLPIFRNPVIKPPLTMKLVHADSAWLESELNDWRVRNGNLIYRSLYSDGGHWAMLEFE